MPLDTDVLNPDSSLTVEFYKGMQHPYVGRDFVRIHSPGDQFNIVDTFVNDEHKRRFPRQWLYYQMQNSEIPVQGTTLTDWQKERPDHVSEFQVAELGILKFQTVEQLATASDSQLQRIGMGGDALRTHAQAFLKLKHAKAAETAAEQAQSSAEQMKAMAAQIAELTAKLADQGEKRGPGRPRKDAEAA